ncbi:MAG: HIT domain-containing protein [Ignavibacteriaceae bacterium]
MEKLWSPWRSQYIDSFKFKNKEKGTECIFCNMKNENADDKKNLLIDKDKLTFTVLNLYPYNNGHLMIVPIRHTDNFITLTVKENQEIMFKLQLACKALKEVLKPDGYNIGANLGKVSGAGIEEHVHFHIVPRWNGDTNFMPVLGEVKVISQDLLSTKEKLREAYLKLMKN